MNFLAVFIGGGLGSLFRYGISLAFLKSRFASFPIATLISNFLACLIFVLFVYFFKVKSEELKWLSPLVLTGICGGFSTFSTFSYETFTLFQQGNIAFAVANILISLLLGLVTFWVLR